MGTGLELINPRSNASILKKMMDDLKNIPLRKNG